MTTDDWSDEELLTALFLHDEGHTPLEAAQVLRSAHGNHRTAQEVVSAAQACGVEWMDKTPTLGVDA